MDWEMRASILGPQGTLTTLVALIQADWRGKALFAVSEEAANATLVREEKKVQWPVYYVSKRLLDAETRYPELEKLALALMVVSSKLRPYFHTHSIDVLTNFPLHQVLQKPEASCRLLKWVIKLGQFDVNFYPRMEIKGQALVDFIVEFTYVSTVEVAGMADDVEVAKVVETRDNKGSVPTQEETQIVDPLCG